MSEFGEDGSMAVSPMANYFTSSVLNVFVLGVLESEIPIDGSNAVQQLQHNLLPINTRFSSIMVEDKNGKKGWKQVDVRLKEHIKIPMFPTKKPLKLYDEEFDEYMTKIAGEPLPQDKPLWQLHLFEYPTKNGAGTFILKLHHALGDGYSLMATMLSCVRRADNPSTPIKFPSSTKSAQSKDHNTKSMFKGLSQSLPMLFKGASDFGWSLLKGNFISDNQTPIRSGHDDVGFRPMTIATVSLSLDSIKAVKNKLNVSVNDALVGIIFLGIRLYMESKNRESSKAHATSLVLLNTRQLRAYKPVKEMAEKNSEAPWGNHFHFMHIPIPELSDKNSTNPLEFVLEANKNINRLRYSLAVPISGVLLTMLHKIKGPQAAAKQVHKTLTNSSLSISAMVGPMEKVALEKHPIKGFYFMTVGLSQSLTVTITSYMGQFRVGFGVEKGWIDESELISCFETSKELILNAARN